MIFAKLSHSGWVRQALWLAIIISVTRAQASTWWAPDPANTLVIDTTKGRIVIEMRPDMAPLATARVKLLAREHVYDGLLFHRVLDHYVDQTGNPNNHDGGTSNHPNLPAEFRFLLDLRKADAIVTRSTDGITGFIGATPFAAVPSPQKPGLYRAWGIYCAGVVGMGRQDDPASANSEIFFMREANRSLDHDYSVWGRVISGLDVVRAITIGEPPPHPDKMLKVQLMADMPRADRPTLQIIDARSKLFADKIAALRKIERANFSICDLDIPVKPAPTHSKLHAQKEKN